MSFYLFGEMPLNDYIYNYTLRSLLISTLARKLVRDSRDMNISRTVSTNNVLLMVAWRIMISRRRCLHACWPFLQSSTKESKQWTHTFCGVRNSLIFLKRLSTTTGDITAQQILPSDFILFEARGFLQFRQIALYFVSQVLEWWCNVQ